MEGHYLPEQRRVIRVNGAGYACSQQFRVWMFFDVSAEMQEFVGNGAQLDADARALVCFLELIQQMGVLHEGEAVADALRV